VLLLAVVVLAFAAFFGWSSAHASAGGGPLVRITERDFKIKAPKHIRAGQVRLRIHNAGPDTHELLLVRVGKRSLPLRRDGMTVDEDALEPLHPVVVEGMERGHGDEVVVKLPPGRYVLFCNMAGHYLSGMHARVIVR
jgi:uncharacterized cupredoxin-like copper-binding protein